MLTKTMVKTNVYIFTLLLLSVAILAGCRERPKSAKSIYRKSASGVVLVANRYYYSMNIGGKFLYFTGINSKGNLLNLTDNVDTVTKNAQTVYGTGFFINKKGDILTNRHIVRPEIDQETARVSLEASVTQIKDFMTQAEAQTAEQYNNVSEKLRAFREYASAHRAAPAKGDEYLFLKLEELSNSYKSYKKVIAQLDEIRYDKIIINCASNVKVAFHKSDTTESDYLKECNITKVSGLDDTDLAVIQLKTKETPKGKYIFHFLDKNRGKRTMFETAMLNLRSDNEARRLKGGTDLCMIGYGKNANAATDGELLKAGVYEGSILQDPDEHWIRYSLPVMDVSSGSPVLNMFGDVVCVNFANTYGNSTFNFGIPLHKIKRFLGMD